MESLLRDVQWDDGYNTLVMLIILRNIDSTIYQSLINQQGYVTPELSADFRKLDKKKRGKVYGAIKMFGIKPIQYFANINFLFLTGNK